MELHLGPELVSLSIEEGFLVGISRAGVLGESVAVSFDGRSWAVVPSKLLPDQRGRSFRCALPPVSEGADGSGTASVIDVFGEPIATVSIPARRDRTNAAGVFASRILSLCDRPFSAVPYLSFDGAVLTLVGSHLPPHGDPSALSVEFDSGVIYNFQYPLESPEWEAHFWYWPNAAMSSFRLTIDLAASSAKSNPFSFRFRYRAEASRAPCEPHGRVWIPKDLGIVVGLPTDPNQLTRVQTWSDTRSVTLTGFNHFRIVEALLEKHGVSRERESVILDWGCGHGRVTRHMIHEWRNAIVIGMDVDAENVAWASANLFSGRFVHSPLMPPSPLEDASVDAVFSVSVMTHLAPDVQRAWLRDLARVVRPRGIVLMSFQGPGAAAWSSIWNDSDYFETLDREGYHANQPDPALRGSIEDPSYYRNVTQSHSHVRREWTEFFDVVEIVEEAIGYLDVAVLRRR